MCCFWREEPLFEAKEVDFDVVFGLLVSAETEYSRRQQFVGSSSSNNNKQV